ALSAGRADALRSPGFPVEIGNDANYAVLAEHRFGEHAGTRDLVYLTGGTSLAAGLLVDGALRRGHSGYSGEAGHIPVPAPGGSARLETVASVTAIARRVLSDEARGDGHLSLAEVELRIDEIVARARAGDTATLTRLDEAAHDLAAGVFTLVSVLDPERVILGGYYAELAPWLLPVVNGLLDTRGVTVEEPIAVASPLGLDAPALG